MMAKRGITSLLRGSEARETQRHCPSTHKQYTEAALFCVEHRFTCIGNLAQVP